MEVSLLPQYADMNDPDTRKHLVAATSSLFTEDGYSIASTLEKFAIDYAQYVEGNTKTLSVPTWCAITERYVVG